MSNDNIDPRLLESIDEGASNIGFHSRTGQEDAAEDCNQICQGNRAHITHANTPISTHHIPSGHITDSDEQGSISSVYELSGDGSLEMVRSVDQTTPRSTNHILSEEELAAQKAYLDSYSLSHTANMASLASQINQDLNQRQRERLLGPSVLEPAVVPQPIISYGGDSSNDYLNTAAQIVAATSQHAMLAQVQANYSSSPASVDFEMQDAPNANSVVPQAYDHQFHGFPSPVDQPMSLLTNTDVLSYTAPPAADIDRLIARAQQVQQQTQMQIQQGLYDGPVACSGSVRATTVKAQAKPKARKSGPTAMQRAPLSISADPNEERVRVEIGEDGNPRVTLREGEDPNQPISIAEIVARPRDEQLTRPRDGEAPIQRVKINSRRSRPPYLPLEDGMNQEELLRRAMRNQEISELDRLDRRTRNNESARRTRERTRKTIADQAETIDQQTIQILGLQGQVAAHQQEIQQLRMELSKECRNDSYIDSLFAE